MNLERFGRSRVREETWLQNSPLLGFQNADSLQLLIAIREQIFAKGFKNPFFYALSSTADFAVFLQNNDWEKWFGNGNGNGKVDLVADLNRWIIYLNKVEKEFPDSVSAGKISFKSAFNSANAREVSLVCWDSSAGPNPEKKDRFYIPILPEETIQTVKYILERSVNASRNIHPAAISTVNKDLKFLQKYYGFSIPSDWEEALEKREEESRNINFMHFLDRGETLLERVFLDKKDVSIFLSQKKLDDILRDAGFKDFYMMLLESGEGRYRRISLDVIFSFIKLLIGVEEYEKIINTNKKEKNPHGLLWILSQFFGNGDEVDKPAFFPDVQKWFKNFWSNAGIDLKKLINNLPANFFYTKEWMGNSAFYQGDSLVNGMGKESKRRDEELSEHPFASLGKDVYLARADDHRLLLLSKEKSPEALFHE